MSNLKKAVFFDIKPQEKVFLEKNKPANFEFIYIKDSFHTGFEANFELINDAEVLSVFTSSRVNDEFLKKMPLLRLIATRSTGYNNVNTDYCRDNNIYVVNVPRYGECTVAEFAFALLMNVIRKVNQAYEELRKGRIDLESLTGHDLFGKTIGLIGTGAIGAYTARIAYGFGMKILSYDPYPNQELIDKFDVTYAELDEIYKNSDIISLHAPAIKSNFHLLNDEAFNLMKNGVIIINTARGEIIDTNALYRALISGKVGGAGLDVLECEEILAKEDYFLTQIDCVKTDCLQKTLINHKLLEMPNVIVTPHIGFDTVEAMERILKTTIENITSYSQGNFINKVN